MRICLVNDYSLEYIGGAVTSLLEQKKALETAGHFVMLLQLGRPIPSAPEGTIFITPTVILGKAFYNLSIMKNSRQNRQEIADILTENAIDIIHFQSEMTLAFTTLAVAKTLKIPTVFTIHTFFWTYPSRFARSMMARILTHIFQFFISRQLKHEQLPGNNVEQALKNITLTLAKESDVVISPSSHQQKIIQATSITTPCVTIANPFTALESAPVPHVISLAPHVPTIIWIGRIESEKRPLEFIEAIRLASASSNSPFTVSIVGDGSQLPAMKHHAHDLPFVTFHGKKSHDEVINLIDASDIIALTSYHYDNQPMIIAEGISRYRPILYCDEQLSDQVDAAGILTTNESTSAMADAIVAFTTNPAVIHTLSVSAQQSSQLFSGSGFVKNIEPVYASLVST